MLKVSLWSSALLATQLVLVATAQVPQPPTVPRSIRPLVLHQTQYRFRAGESAKIDAPPETLDFVRNAKSRAVTVNGAEGRGFVVGPDVGGDQVLLAASLTMKPGVYAVTVSAVSGTGEERAAAVNVTRDPLQTVPNGATVPPVVLLNGWQFGYSTCPISSGSSATFGSLEGQLRTGQSVAVYSLSKGGVIDGAGVPVVYFFDNCVEDPNGPIENLGAVLGNVLNLIQYRSEERRVGKEGRS